MDPWFFFPRVPHQAVGLLGTDEKFWYPLTPSRLRRHKRVISLVSNSLSTQSQCHRMFHMSEPPALLLTNMTACYSNCTIFPILAWSRCHISDNSYMIPQWLCQPSSWLSTVRPCSTHTFICSVKTRHASPTQESPRFTTGKLRLNHNVRLLLKSHV